MIFWLIFALLITVIYIFDKHRLSYWSKRGFFQEEPSFLLGNFPLLNRKKSMGEFFADVYKKHKNNHKLLGFYFSYRPVLIVNDPKLIQDVLIKDFNSFHDRNIPVNEERDPLSAHLFALTGQRWRDLRVKLSPAFSSGKLKIMYPTILSCAKVLENYLSRNVKEGNNIFEFRDLLGRFTTNVISSVAFGVENDCINDPENIFRQMGLKIFQPSLKRRIASLIALLTPSRIAALMQLKKQDELTEFFFDLVKRTIEYRENNENEQKRKDFMQLLIELKSHGFVSVDKYSGNEINNEDKLKNLTLNEIVAQAFLFFIAGFETSSSTMNFCLIELCKNPRIQQKVREEIYEVSQGNEISYEDLNELKYLENVIDETLRKYSLFPILNRKTTQNYEFSNGLVIEKGTQVIIPVLGLHRDAKFYENPLKFDPERFSKFSTGSDFKEGLTYFAFGNGPRNCIGARLGKLQVKIGLVSILSKFYIELLDENLINQEIEFDTKQFILTPKNPIMMKITSI